MKVLIAINSEVEAQHLFKDDALPAFKHNKAIFNFKHIELTVLITGFTQYETAFAMSRALLKTPYNLVLQLGVTGSLDEEIEVGKVVNIIRDKAAWLGEGDESGLKNAYQMEWLNPLEKPHVRKGYINMTNSYFNVFLPFHKVANITTHQLKGNEVLIERKLSDYPNHTESTNGMAFQYACLYQQVAFYQIRAVSYNLATGEEDADLAIQNLSKAIHFILNKL